MATCSKCGVETQSLAYHICKTLSEERVREIAREEIRSELLSRDLDSSRQPVEGVKAARIRDAALEEAAKIADEWYPQAIEGEHNKLAQRIRALKTQPAAKPNAAMEEWIAAANMRAERDAQRKKMRDVADDFRLLADQIDPGVEPVKEKA